MAETIRFVEETFRDGQLSLWATRMDTRTMLGIAGHIDGAGFQRVCVSSGAAFDTTIRFLREDPWERLRLLRQEMPRTPLEFLIRGRNVIGWKRYPDDVAALMLRCLKRIGLEWMLIFDGLNDFRNIAFHIRFAKQIGMKVSAYLSYAESPVHTDAYWVRKARELVHLDVDVINFGDPAGLFSPARARTLVPALLAEIDGKAELLMSVHTSTGQALDCYDEAMRLGARSLATCALPLANSESLPATSDMIARARTLGFEVSVDERLAREIDAYFSYVALRDGRPSGQPVRYDEEGYAKYLGHQIPGGMMSNFVRQHREAGTLSLLPAILEEMARVRAELGYPPMVTPWSQLVGVQATLNVTSGVRYGTVPDEIKLYARGFYGELAAPIEVDVLDRILAGGQQSPLDPAAIDAEQVLPKLRAKHPFVSDEDLILRIFYDQSTLDGFAAGVKPVDENAITRTPLTALIASALCSKGARSVRVTLPETTQTLSFADVATSMRAIKAGGNINAMELTGQSMTVSIERLGMATEQA